jgi:Arabinose efflux permease
MRKGCGNLLAKSRAWKTTFGAMWVGQSLSLLKHSITMFAIIWYYTQSTGSATILALITAIKQIPHVIMSPFGGVLADRFPRKTILIISNLSVSFMSILIGVLFATGAMRITYIYILVFIADTAASFITPIMQASVPMIAPKEKFTRLVSLMQIITALVSVLGPVCGALLIKFMNISLIMFINAGIALLAIIPLLFIIIPQPERVLENTKEKTSFFADFLFGLKYIVHWRGIFVILLIGAACNFLANPPLQLLPILITKAGGGVGIYATAQALVAIGLIGSAVVLTIWGGFKKKSMMMMVSQIGMAAGLTLMLLPVLPLAVRIFTGAFILGISVTFYNISLATIVASEVDKEVQGRVMAVGYSLLAAATPLGLFISGVAADKIGINIIFIVAAILLFIMGFIILKVPALRDFEKHRQPAHVCTDALEKNEITVIEEELL